MSKYNNRTEDNDTPVLNTKAENTEYKTAAEVAASGNTTEEAMNISESFLENLFSENRKTSEATKIKINMLWSIIAFNLHILPKSGQDGEVANLTSRSVNYIGDSDPQHDELIKKFLKYIIFEKCDGNFAQLNDFLNGWFQNAHNKIKTLQTESSPEEKQHGRHKVEDTDLTTQDPLILEILEKIAPNDQSPEAESKTETPETANAETKSALPTAEITKTQLLENIKDNIAEALIWEFRGDFQKAQELYDKALNSICTDIDPEPKNADKLSQEDHLRNFIYHCNFLISDQRETISSEAILAYLEKIVSKESTAAIKDFAISHELPNLQLLKLAADRGDDKARYELGKIYSDETALKPNFHEAYRYLNGLNIPGREFEIGIRLALIKTCLGEDGIKFRENIAALEEKYQSYKKTPEDKTLGDIKLLLSQCIKYNIAIRTESLKTDTLSREIIEKGMELLRMQKAAAQKDTTKQEAPKTAETEEKTIKSSKDFFKAYQSLASDNQKGIAGAQESLEKLGQEWHQKYSKDVELLNSYLGEYEALDFESDSSNNSGEKAEIVKKVEALLPQCLQYCEVYKEGSRKPGSHQIAMFDHLKKIIAENKPTTALKAKSHGEEEVRTEKPTSAIPTHMIGRTAVIKVSSSKEADAILSGETTIMTSDGPLKFKKELYREKLSIFNGDTKALLETLKINKDSNAEKKHQTVTNQLDPTLEVDKPTDETTANIELYDNETDEEEKEEALKKTTNEDFEAHFKHLLEFHPEKALNYEKRAADHGVTAALTNLGTRHFNARNFEEAARLFKLAEGYPIANRSLGMSYVQGWGVPVDLAEAERLLLSCPKDADTEYGLGCVYFEKSQLENNRRAKKSLLEKAKEHYQLSAKQGDIAAHFQLFKIYKKLKDHKSAFESLLVAANNNYQLSSYQIGYYYLTGKGTPKNIAEAKRFFKLSLATAGIEARIKLGIANLEEGEEQNFMEAYHHLKTAIVEYPEGKKPGILLEITTKPEDIEKKFREAKEQWSKKFREDIESLNRMLATGQVSEEMRKLNHDCQKYITIYNNKELKNYNNYLSQPNEKSLETLKSIKNLLTKKEPENKEIENKENVITTEKSAEYRLWAALMLGRRNFGTEGIINPNERTYSLGNLKTDDKQFFKDALQILLTKNSMKIDEFRAEIAQWDEEFGEKINDLLAKDLPIEERNAAIKELVKKDPLIQEIRQQLTAANQDSKEAKAPSNPKGKAPIAPIKSAPECFIDAVCCEIFLNKEATKNAYEAVKKAPHHRTDPGTKEAFLQNNLKYSIYQNTRDFYTKNYPDKVAEYEQSVARDIAYIQNELSPGKLKEYEEAAQEKAEQEIRKKEAQEKAERERKDARERKTKERLEKERLEKERLEKARLEKERLENERLEKERLEKERLEKERLEKERLEKERLEKERLEKERLEKERLENERLEKERLENERLENERLENERLEKERLEKERLEKERLEKERLEKERVEQKAREDQDQIHNKIHNYWHCSSLERSLECNHAIHELYRTLTKHHFFEAFPDAVIVLKGSSLYQFYVDTQSQEEIEVKDIDLEIKCDLTKVNDGNYLWFLRDLSEQLSLEEATNPKPPTIWRTSITENLQIIFKHNDFSLPLEITLRNQTQEIIPDHDWVCEFDKIRVFMTAKGFHVGSTAGSFDEYWNEINTITTTNGEYSININNPRISKKIAAYYERGILSNENIVHFIQDNIHHECAGKIIDELAGYEVLDESDQANLRQQLFNAKIAFLQTNYEMSQTAYNDCLNYYRQNQSFIQPQTAEQLRQIGVRLGNPYDFAPPAYSEFQNPTENKSQYVMPSYPILQPEASLTIHMPQYPQTQQAYQQPTSQQELEQQGLHQQQLAMQQQIYQQRQLELQYLAMSSALPVNPAMISYAQRSGGQQQQGARRYDRKPNHHAPKTAPHRTEAERAETKTQAAGRRLPHHQENPSSTQPRRQPSSQPNGVKSAAMIQRQQNTL